MQYRYGFDNSNLDLYIEYSKVQSNKPSMKSNHYHDGFEIYYYLGEEMTYFINNKNIRLKRHDLVLINESTFHKTNYFFKGTEERILFLFKPGVFNFITDSSIIEGILKLFRTKNKISVPENMKERVYSIISRSVENFCSTTPEGVLKAKLNLLELLLTIKEMDDQGSLTDDENSTNLVENKITEIVNYINSNYQDEISLDLLANMFFVNKYYLCHIFKKVTGLSVIEFINNKRITEAEKLLKSSSYNITEICSLVGFNNMNHFIKLFKEKNNCTPKKMRKETPM